MIRERPPTPRDLELLRLSLLYGFTPAAEAAGITRNALASAIGDLADRLGVQPRRGGGRDSRLIRCAIAVGWLVIPRVPRAGRSCPIHLIPYARSVRGPGKPPLWRCPECRKAYMRAYRA